MITKQKPINVTHIADVSVDEGRSMTVTLSNGKKLEGIIAGKLSLDSSGTGALVTMSILCKPTINGRTIKDQVSTRIIAPDGRPYGLPPPVTPEQEPEDAASPPPDSIEAALVRH